MGVTIAYKLSQYPDLRITIYERGNELGGLAGYIPFDGVRLDRFYHTILSSDMLMQRLIKDTGIDDLLHFTETKQGFYDDGKHFSFNSPMDLLTFGPLNLVQRLRLALQIVVAQFENDWRKMDIIPVEEWLIRVSGRGVFEKVWKPLLRAKFDTEFTDVPATYIWSRLKRMMGTRKGATSKEMMCYIETGYHTLIEAMAEVCRARGTIINLNTPVEEIVIENKHAQGIESNGDLQRYDLIVSTLQSPILGNLIPDGPQDYRNQLLEQKFLGVLCPLMILDRTLIPYYVLNITDEEVPFTAIVETTNLINPSFVKNHHLVYLPKYIAPDNEMMFWPDEKVKSVWLSHLKGMFPHFDRSWISDFKVQRARLVEPLHPLGTNNLIPTIRSPIDGLYIGNTAMIYPELSNGESVTRFAQKVAGEIVQSIFSSRHGISSTELISR